MFLRLRVVLDVTIALSLCICDAHSPLLDIMTRNVAMNDLADRVAVLELNWSARPVLPAVHVLTHYARRGDPLPASLPHFDLILAADCVYFEPSFPLLVQTLQDLVDRQPDAHPEVLFCYKKRRKVRVRGVRRARRQYLVDG